MHTNTLKEFHFEVLCIAVVSVAAAYKALPRDQCCSNDSGIETVVSRCMDSYSNPSLSHWKSVVCCPTTRSSHYRGAALTLVWNISAYLIISYCFQNADKYVRNAFMVSVLLYPIAGWLADVYLGRYRVIRCSLWIMWTAAVVHGAVWALKTYIPHYHIIKNISYGAGFIGLSGFQFSTKGYLVKLAVWLVVVVGIAAALEFFCLFYAFGDLLVYFFSLGEM